MADDRDLQALERGAYHDSYNDGIIDIFVGASLVWIGVAWIWLPDLAGLAGVFPAVFVAPMLEARKRFLAPRAGHVTWAESRRRWERRSLTALVAFGVATFLLGIGAYLVVSNTSADRDVWSLFGPGMIAWLLALLAFVLGLLLGAWRMLGYGVVLVLGGIAAAWVEANPGWPLLLAGIPITITGTIMLVRFVRHNPIVEAP